MAFSRGMTTGGKPARGRVGGSGFTAFYWDSQPIGFCRELAHTSGTPVGPGPTPLQPLDEPYPIDILTPAAMTIGTLSLELYELYNHKVWDQLRWISGELDLVNVFLAMAEHGPVQIVKVVRSPVLAGAVRREYADIFHGCVITNVEDGERIEIGTMEITKRLTVAYTKTTR